MKVSGMTYRAIGQALGVSRQRVQQMLRPPIRVYDQLRRRAANKCEKCGLVFKARGHGHAHHLRYGDFWNVNDLLYICPACHRSEEFDCFRYLPVAERKAASEAFIAPFVDFGIKRYCLVCSTEIALKNSFCAPCKRKLSIIRLIKSRMAAWHREKNGAPKTGQNLSQAIWLIRKHGIKPEDLGPRR